MISDVIGWIGSIAFAVCGLPQAWDCFKNKTAKGISPVFIFFWLLGEVCYIVSIFVKFGWISWMMFNYIINLVSIAVISYYLVRDRKMQERQGAIQAQTAEN